MTAVRVKHYEQVKSAIRDGIADYTKHLRNQRWCCCFRIAVTQQQINLTSQMHLHNARDLTERECCIFAIAVLSIPEIKDFLLKAMQKKKVFPPSMSSCITHEKRVRRLGDLPTQVASALPVGFSAQDFPHHDPLRWESEREFFKQRLLPDAYENKAGIIEVPMKNDPQGIMNIEKEVSQLITTLISAPGVQYADTVERKKRS